jgi:hypothetical protein
MRVVKRAFLIIGVAVVIVVGGLAIAWSDGRKSHKFNAATWRADAGGTCATSRRGKMADDLIEHYLKRGMRPQHVHRLLGPPYAHLQRSHVRGEWWPTGWAGNDSTVLSVWYRDGSFTDAHMR